MTSQYQYLQEIASYSQVASWWSNDYVSSNHRICISSRKKREMGKNNVCQWRTPLKNIFLSSTKPCLLLFITLLDTPLCKGGCKIQVLTAHCNPQHCKGTVGRKGFVGSFCPGSDHYSSCLMNEWPLWSYALTPEFPESVTPHTQWRERVLFITVLATVMIIVCQMELLTL